LPLIYSSIALSIDEIIPTGKN
jgi:hypothetical protein